MDYHPEDFEKVERIGQHRSGAVMHMLTKGGLSSIGIHNTNGEFTILSKSPHFGISLYMAQQVDPTIQWDQDLIKSSHGPILSTPENHYKQAKYFSKLAGRDLLKLHQTDDKHAQAMRILMCTKEACDHYRMAGVDEDQLINEHKKNALEHAQLTPREKPPFDNEELKALKTSRK
jgi:hypothetical protein